MSEKLYQLTSPRPGRNKNTSPGTLSKVGENARSCCRPGVVVLGGDYQGLGIVRSLGARGIPVFVLDDEHSIARFSRYVVGSAHVPDLRNEASTIKTLVEMAERHHLQDCVLFPTRDELVAILSRNRSFLTNWFRVPTPEWEITRWLWDKRNTYDMARKQGIPIPRTWMPKSLADVDKLHFEFPVVIKPAIKEHFFYATRAKAWRANSKAELSALFQRACDIARPGEIMIQEFVPGGGESQLAYCAFFKNGKALADMSVRRKRQHPHDFGRASTYVETIEMAEIGKWSQRFLKSIDYYGLVEVEFKQDPRDGRLRLLDANARTWGYHTLGKASGVDFCHLLYRDQIGEDVISCSGRPGVSWLRLLTDLPTGILDVCHGRLKLSDYLQSVIRAREHAVFSIKDPLPALVEFALLPYLFVRRGF